MAIANVRRIYALNPHRFLAEGLAVYLHTTLASNGKSLGMLEEEWRLSLRE